jgi:hypothetical protein
MGLKDKVVRALALRWLRGEVKDLRGKEKETTMGKVLKFLDGWKLVIAVVVLFATRVYDAANNGHTGDIVGAFLAALGWAPPAGFISPEAMTTAAAGALALWGVVHKVIKATQQVQAGSSVAGSLTTEGYIAKYVADVQAGKAVEPPSAK